MFILRTIIILVAALLLHGCKSRGSQLQDGFETIEEQTDEEGNVTVEGKHLLYWLVGSESNRVICRSECEDVSHLRGQTISQELRRSCNINPVSIEFSNIAEDAEFKDVTEKFIEIMTIESGTFRELKRIPVGERSSDLDLISGDIILRKMEGLFGLDFFYYQGEDGSKQDPRCLDDKPDTLTLASERYIEIAKESGRHVLHVPNKNLLYFFYRYIHSRGGSEAITQHPNEKGPSLKLPWGLSIDLLEHYVKSVRHELLPPVEFTEPQNQNENWFLALNRTHPSPLGVGRLSFHLGARNDWKPLNTSRVNFYEESSGTTFSFDFIQNDQFDFEFLEKVHLPWITMLAGMSSDPTFRSTIGYTTYFEAIDGPTKEYQVWRRPFSRQGGTNPVHLGDLEIYGYHLIWRAKGRQL